MEVSLAFGQIVGVYLLIMGVSLLARRRGWMHIIKEVRKNPSLTRLVAMLELLVGLVIVIFHWEWATGDWRVVVTLVGLLMTLEGAAYLLMSHKSVANIFKTFNKPGWLNVCGIVMLLLGSYVALQAFELGVL